MRLSPDIVEIVWVSVSALCSAVHYCVLYTANAYHGREEVGPANLSSCEYKVVLTTYGLESHMLLTDPPA